jgi:hypothetical protein
MMDLFVAKRSTDRTQPNRIRGVASYYAQSAE